MPSIDIAMAQSLGRRSVLDVLAAAIHPVLFRRDISSKISDVKTAFSSWDNCMNAAYCKWPVIALIIIGGLIILSIVWCIVRCACCGVSCCCECCQCLKCCGNCCGMCDPPRGKSHKYLDEPYIPPHQGYRSEPPMDADNKSTFKSADNNPFKPADHAPQYASYDVSKKEPIGEDSLPEMPSWENANHKKVLVEDESVELSDLKKPEAAGQAVPLMSGASRSPVAGSPGGMGNSYAAPGATSPTAASTGDYMAAAAIPAVARTGSTDPYGRNNQGYNNNQFNNSQFNNSQPSNNGAYGGGYGDDYGYGQQGMGAGGQSPVLYNNQQPRFASPAPQQQQSRYASPAPQFASPAPQSQQSRYASPAPSQAYQAAGGYDDFRGTPGPQGYGMDRQTPQPQIPEMGGDDQAYGASAGGGYGSSGYGGAAAAAAPYGGASNSPRALTNRPPPLRQYSSTPLNNNANSGTISEMPGSPGSPANLQNNAGFDFSSGYSRPPTRDRDTYGFPRTASTSPPPLAHPQPQQASYPGYRAYQGGQSGGWN